MKRILILSFLLFTINPAFSQNKKIIQELCHCLQTTSLPDTARLQDCQEKTMMEKYVTLKSEKKRIQFEKEIEAGLNRNCVAYYELRKRLYPFTEEWIRLEKMIPSQLALNVCNEIIQHKKLYYIEPIGDTTFITIQGKVLTERYIKGEGMSKYHFEMKDNCEFVLTFIESSGPCKIWCTDKGTKYTYRLIKKADNYYTAIEKGHRINYQFKLYFQN